MRNDVIDLISAHIKTLPLESLFTTRDLLHFGTRSAVDNAVSTLIKRGEFCRVIRGVFCRKDREVSVLELAIVKAKSFGRRLCTHARDIAKNMGFTLADSAESESNSDFYFATDGRSSKFSFASRVIHLEGVNPRKISLSDSLVGQAIRLLIFLGRKGLQQNSVGRVLGFLGLGQRMELLRKSAQMPSWLSDILHNAEFAVVEPCSTNAVSVSVIYEIERAQDPRTSDTIAEYLPSRKPSLGIHESLETRRQAQLASRIAYVLDTG